MMLVVAQMALAQSFALLHAQRIPVHDASACVEASLGPPLLLPLDPPLPELEPLLDPEALPSWEGPSLDATPPSLRATSGTE